MYTVLYCIALHTHIYILYTYQQHTHMYHHIMAVLFRGIRQSLKRRREGPNDCKEN